MLYKHLLSIVAVVLLIGLLAGCGGKSADPAKDSDSQAAKPVTLKIGAPPDPTNRSSMKWLRS
jgi:uncharacterized lipoprotein